MYLSTNKTPGTELGKIFLIVWQISILTYNFLIIIPMYIESKYCDLMRLGSTV